MSTSPQGETWSAAFSTLQRPSVPEASYEAFFKLIERLEALLAEETNFLKMGVKFDLPEMTRRKRVGFLELNRLMRTFDGTIPSQDIIDRLASFRGRVDESGTMLRLHLQAAQDVTAIIVRTMQESDSDGTYTRSFLFRGFEFS